MKRPPAWVPDRRDIIWIDFNPHVGAEMKDLHPLLVLTPRNFCNATSLVIGLPMTTATFNELNPFAIKVIWENGLISYVLAAQPKSFDWRRRRATPHPLGQVPAEAYRRACLTLNRIIEIC
ncbi:type II toxin-antitoxin system PemK/MazF family toxin [Pseudoduganella sp. FT93W]|uniref:Type II toxin-antitoxin system PemK/MazF family toxin n=1 Tax=Duganella fentianensis TaxID=2692177 RepID=A0A845I5N7_9BURK|nr:type II toxin-antitoxin system PemK/MazF family toxin [Duganella fentianensis]MYN46976.1 type II toxin-antitoxin system PemK/MazF family toxin [Duganella fentianensis]